MFPCFLDHNIMEFYLTKRMIFFVRQNFSVDVHHRAFLPTLDPFILCFFVSTSQTLQKCSSATLRGLKSIQHVPVIYRISTLIVFAKFLSLAPQSSIWMVNNGTIHVMRIVRFSALQWSIFIADLSNPPSPPIPPDPTKINICPSVLIRPLISDRTSLHGITKAVVSISCDELCNFSKLLNILLNRQQL